MHQSHLFHIHRYHSNNSYGDLSNFSVPFLLQFVSNFEIVTIMSFSNRKLHSVRLNGK